MPIGCACVSPSITRPVKQLQGQRHCSNELGDGGSERRAGHSPWWIWPAAMARTCAPWRHCLVVRSIGAWSTMIRHCWRRYLRHSPHWARRHNYRLTVEDRAGEVEPINIIGPNFHAKVERQRVDLAIDLPRLDFSEATLVTASALLDLVSASWLQTLICKAKATRVAMLFALNVDGPITWDPGDPADEHVHALFSRHQNRDKGFGPALGSQAVAIALQRMASAGYQTQQTRTDWLIDGAQAPEMQLAMVQGMAVAALEQDPTTRDAVQSWKARRDASIGVSRLRVGHVDIVATPT